MFRGLSTLARLTPAALAPAVALCDEKSARGALADLIDKSEARRGDGTSLGPTMVRLAWHSAGTFCARTGTGGSDGGRMKYCPESAWGANAGLGDVRAVVEKVAQDHGLSRADAYTLAGVVAVAHMGGPEVPWAAGRSDAADGSTSPPDGRLPDADKGSLGGTVAHLRAIFYRMGFDDRDIVALSGAHALGRCHEEASGYWGPWTFAETTFSHEYFRLLLEETWTLKTTHNGRTWKGPDQFEDSSGKLMMLPSDIALVWDKTFRAYVILYSKDEEQFFKDFSRAFGKLLALGTKQNGGGGGGGPLDGLRKLFGL